MLLAVDVSLWLAVLVADGDVEALADSVTESVSEAERVRTSAACDAASPGSMA